MNDTNILSSAEDWRESIAALKDDRCDLDILLKGPWRHKIVVRDDGNDPGQVHDIEAVVEGAAYAALTAFVAHHPGVSVSAMVLVCLHRALEAYGNGAQTVIGCVKGDGASARVQPSIIDHRLLTALSRLDVVRDVERALARDDAFVAANALLGQGLFDAVLIDAGLIETTHERALSGMPPLPLALSVRNDPAGQRLQCRLYYAPELFEAEVMKGVLDIVVEALRQIDAHPDGAIADLELISQEQKRQLDRWNATDGEFPEASRLDELFEAAVRRSPDRCAVVCGDERLSYDALNRRCNRFAHRLLREGVQPGEIVGLYLDKSYRIVVSTIGVWKAGAAYIPFDPSYPADRIQFTMRDTGSRRIVTHRHYTERLREMLAEVCPDLQIVDIDEVLADAGGDAEDQQVDPDLRLGSGQIAYVTYTSGTTGIPKGVPKAHRSVVNSITDLSERYQMRAAGTEHVALFAALVFEPFMRQTLIALINSQTLVVVPDDVRLDPMRFPRFVAEHSISYLNGTLSVLQHFDLRECTSLKRMLLVGEELTPSGLRTLREKFHGRIINEYAFTETAFVTATKEYPPGDDRRIDRSIGRPLRNVKCYVLSQNLKQVPIGAIGELYIGGTGVAGGYLNRPDLTAERFLDNPFRTDEERTAGRNARMYKTGDLARFLTDGQIEFMGRSDFQLKLNGVRVELGEIEARTLEYPGVRQCVVMTRGQSVETGNWRLVGYYVADRDQPVLEADLLAYLESRLIRVMIPARMVRLDAFPVNVNGKVDRRALPEVGLHAAPAVQADSPADAALEDGLIGALKIIWSEVLGVRAADIGEDDDFFRLGGQSITCLQLIMRIWQRLRVSISVEDVYRLKNFGQLAHSLMLKVAEDADALVLKQEPETSAPGDDVRMLATGLQQGMLFQAMKSTATNDAYVMQSLHHYRRAIKAEAMRQAWTLAQRTYPSLRLRFEWRDEALQCLDGTTQPLAWRYIDLSDLDDAQIDVRLSALQRQDRLEPYRLEQGQLFRVYLIKRGAASYSLLFSCHHIILDGWSLPLLHDTVHRFYIRLQRNEPVDVQEDTAYVTAQRYLEAHRDAHLDYWKSQFERLGEAGNFAGLISARNRYKVDFGDYDTVLEHRTRTLSVDARCIGRIKDWCTGNRVTLHSVLQFAWHEVLFAVGGSTVTSVGTVVSGRGLPVDGIENSVGLYINTLPSIVDHAGQAQRTVAEALAEIQDTINRMNSRSAVELFLVQTQGSKRRLFETLLVLENYPRLLDEDEAALHHEFLRFEKSYDSDKVDYPIAVVARENGDRLDINLWYAGELFDESTVDTLLAMLDSLFHQVAGDFDAAVSGLDLVCSEDRRRFEDWNRTEATFPEHRTLHAGFEIAADTWPDVVAVVSGENRLTYRDLNQRANRMARFLCAQAPLVADRFVALVVDKSEWMIAAILAVWKAGAAYVPIDPSYPDDRVRFILEDTGALLVLTDSPHVDRLRELAEGLPCQVFGVQDVPLAPYADDNPASPTTSTDLAYAIYTSGTTGRPKSVLVEHRGVVNLHTSLEKLFALRRDQGDEAILSFSNYVFDHFVEQMTDALLSGQTLVMLDDAMRSDKARLYAYMNRNRVTYLSGTPSVLSLYEYGSIPSLKRIDAIGEDFTTPVFDKIRSTFDGLIINGYGPTEISITSHKRLYLKHEPRLDKSIGHPVANTACYVLNPRMQRVPVGGIGELYIGGTGVARGYLNRPELTAERFVANPFQSDEEKREGVNGRLYKTGDLVRWLPNGELEYLGRNDMQVKIRGQRVELGEIEAILAACPGVARAIVLARQFAGAAAGGDAAQKYLVAFYLSERELPETEILRWMRARLPQAIVPVRAIRIPEIPVTASGKLDIKCLPATEFALEGRVDHVAPTNQTERDLCRLWAKMIGLSPDRVGIRDDFFGSGGDSLRAIHLAQSITEHFAQSFNVAAVFAHPNIEAQAKHLKDSAAHTSREEPSPAGMAATVGATPPVSLAQERLLFIDDYVEGTAAYNVPFACVLDAGRGETQTAADVEAALRVLLRRHAALRTLLQGTGDGTRVQKILDEDEAARRFDVPLTTVPDRAALDRELVAGFAHVFRLEDALPVRAHLFTVADMPQRIVLGLVFHHACFDGWSWRIFREELESLLAGTPAGDLPTLKATYADFAVWQRQQLSSQRLGVLNAHWQQALSGWQPLNLPLDHPRPTQFDYLGREVVFEIDGALTDQLKVLAQTSRISFFSVMLAAYYLTLQSFSGQSDLIVGTPSAHRRHGDFDRVVGFFTNLVALRTTIDNRGRLLDYLRGVGQLVLQAQLHEDLPFEQVVKALGVEADASRHPVFQAIFSLLNEESVGAASSSLARYAPDDDGRTTAKFDLSATVSEQAHGLSVNVTYAAQLFDPASIGSIVATYRQILREFCRLAPRTDSAVLSEIRYVEPLPRPALAARAPCAETLHATFARMAAAHAAATAVVQGDTRLTYAALDVRANQLAHALRRHAALAPGDFVALAMDKSEWSIIAILAVWKAGAAYVPIDPGHPDERISFMLEDTRAKLVLADEACCARIRELVAGGGTPVLDVRALRLDDEPHAAPVVAATREDIAYAIYTSGTTGRPKAVLVRHVNVQSFRDGLAERYFGDGEQRQAVLFLSSYVFDFSIEQLVLSILSGHTLIVPEAVPFFDDAFYRRMNRDGLSYISGTPSQLQLFDLSRLDHLVAVLVAGEAFRAHHFDKIRQEFAGPLYNAYGTTETTVYNLVRCFATGAPFRNDLGTVLPNTELHILDRDLRELPTGGFGEICIVGDCVSAGYLNRDELTRTRFVPNPFQTDIERNEARNASLYRTGDIVRRRHTGELEFFGRNDHQVKINGVRIEPGEIEAVAAAFPGIEQCAVVARNDAGPLSGSRLVCYYVAKADVSESDLANHLRTTLTLAMVPSTLTRIDGALPLTVNGKLDVAALARFDKAADDADYVAPAGRLEVRLSRIWSDVLNGRLVGVHDNFFQIGGDSISALHLTSHIRRKFNQKVSVKQVFDFPTVRSFCTHVLKTLPIVVPERPHVPPAGDCRRLPIQDWFFAKALHDRGHWNQYLTIRTPVLDVERIHVALDKLARHHDAFRLRYRVSETDPTVVVQHYADVDTDIAHLLHVVDLDAADEDTLDARLHALQGSFDLAHGPLCRAAVVSGFADGTARVWMSLHHLIVDVVSWGILCRDLEALYQGEALEPPSSDIGCWAEALHAYTPGADERRLWEATAREVEAEKAVSPWVRSGRDRHHERFELGREETAALIGRRSRSVDINTVDLMLAALGQTLHALTGRPRHFVVMESHGREALNGAPDVQDTLGWFTTMHPLAVVGTDDIGESLAATRANRRRIAFNGIGYGALRGTYGGEQAPLPDISFNYLGMFTQPQASQGNGEPDATARWQLDAARCGISQSDRDANASEGLIDISARCIGDRMVVDVDSRLDAETTDRFAELFKMRLEACSAYMAEARLIFSPQGKTSSAAYRSVEFEPCFVLNETAKGPTLFVLPPGEGGAESYMNNLAKQLPQLRLVLFNNVHLHTPMVSFEDIAQYYLPHIRRLQPHGPYHFFGWSFGGVCSMELALQLQAEGEHISNLLMVDSFFNTEKVIEDLGLPRHGNSLDPINHRYRPNRQALKVLVDGADNVVLFKAVAPIVEHESEEQRRVFEYYARAPFNNLDTLLPSSSFALELLGDNSHFSWVHDKATVDRVCARIVSALQEKMAV